MLVAPWIVTILDILIPNRSSALSSARKVGARVRLHNRHILIPSLARVGDGRHGVRLGQAGHQHWGVARPSYQPRGHANALTSDRVPNVRCHDAAGRPRHIEFLRYDMVSGRVGL
jgi:hypothetical protein